LYTLQTESIPIIVEIAPLLSDEQMARFKRKLEERSEKWKADWWQETKEEQLAVRLEKTVDFANKVYGNLDDAQLNLLKQSLAQANIDPALRYKEILRRNQDAYQIVSELKNQSLSLDEKSQLVKAGFDRIRNSPNQAYQAHADALTQHTCKTIAEMHASTNAQQKLHAKNWLNDYIEQLTALQVK
jgi:predicted Zn-dependent protease